MRLLVEVVGILFFALEFLEKDNQHRRVEEELLLFMNLIDQSSDAIFVIAPHTGRILYANTLACDNLGYENAELLTKGMTDIEETLEDEASWKEHIRKVRREGRVLFEGRQRRKDGTTFPVEASIRYIAHEKKQYLVAVARDITDRRVLDEEKKALEGQLRHAQKMEAIGQLAGGIAHDFNNILTGIIGYGYLLTNKMASDDPLKFSVARILESADRAAQLVHSILAFSTKQIVNIMPVNLAELVQRVERFLVRLIGEDIDLRTIVKERVTVMADSGQLEQILMNLATNARDAMPSGGSLTITLDLWEMSDKFIARHGYGKAGIYARISVSDTGDGMDEETRKRIFEPFFTTKKMGKGTGLGLAIVYGIVKQHNGFINVDSEPSKGTTFTVYIPSFSYNATEKPASSLPNLIRGGTETLLVAEDDEILRKLLITIFEDYGYRVIIAKDGEDAVEKFVQNKDAIRLAVVDIMMPRKDGKKAYDEMKKIRPDIKVVFISGYSADLVHRDAILADGLELMVKPVAPADLLQKVRSLLDG